MKKNNYLNDSERVNVLCDLLIKAFRDGRIKFYIEGDKYENYIEIKMVIDGKLIVVETGILY